MRGGRVQVDLFERGTVIGETFNRNGWLNVKLESGEVREVWFRHMVELTTAICWDPFENRFVRGTSTLHYHQNYFVNLNEYVEYNKSSTC